MKIKCKCGCGVEIEKFDKRGRERYYSIGHYFKGKKVNVWNKGKKDIYSDETLDKMSKAKIGTSFRKGKLASEITKNKISVAKVNEWKDKKQSEKSRKLKLRAKNMARKIELNKSCDICNSTENLQRHHWDYNKPLLVNTLCSTCHKIQHIKNFNNSKYARREVIICHI